MPNEIINVKCCFINDIKSLINGILASALRKKNSKAKSVRIMENSCSNSCLSH